jgi:phospholipase C
MSSLNGKQYIQNIFVLMLENRSFDHMLGFSGITGIDASSGQHTIIDGLSGTESNSYQGKSYPVTQPADYSMPFDPGHEFTDVVTQLSGADTQYPSGGPYPAINNSGFVYDYATTTSPGEGGATNNFGEIMKCYAPNQLPVMNALAREFAVCDHWYSAIPGPTWPNRFFVMAASSGGLDHSPTTAEILEWETVNGFSFPHGSIFDLVNNNTTFGCRIYRGDVGNVAGSIPIASALKNIQITDTFKFSNFQQDISQASYPWPLTFIEPNYGDIINNSYAGGTSQHPMDDVRNGERLIKQTYEAIRNSPHWDNSLLIITYDEHGGFYDHVAPPQTVPPGDGTESSSFNKYGFHFKQLGVRVPALVISPYVSKNIIDHRNYEHASVPATISDILGLTNLTDRDASASNLTRLLSLSTPRTDCPTSLPDPPKSVEVTSFLAKAKNPNEEVPLTGNFPGFLAAALKEQLQLAKPYEHDEIIRQYTAIKTRSQAEAFMAKTMQMVDHYQLLHPKR